MIRMLPERYASRPAELILTLPRRRDASTRADLLNLQTLATRYRGAAELTPNSTRPKCPACPPPDVEERGISNSDGA